MCICVCWECWGVNNLLGGFHYWLNKFCGEASPESTLRDLRKFLNGNCSRQLHMIHMWLSPRQVFKCMVASPSHSAGCSDTINIC